MIGNIQPGMGLGSISKPLAFGLGSGLIAFVKSDRIHKILISVKTGTATFLTKIGTINISNKSGTININTN